MQFFGLEITGDHARLILPAIGGALAVGGFIAGRWWKHRARVRFAATLSPLDWRGDVWDCRRARWQRHAAHRHPGSPQL